MKVSLAILIAPFGKHQSIHTVTVVTGPFLEAHRLPVVFQTSKCPTNKTQKRFDIQDVENVGSENKKTLKLKLFTD